MTKALAVRDPQAEIEAIREKVVELEQNDLGIVESMNRFSEVDEAQIALLEALPDDLLRKQGWTRRQLRVAKYAQLPRSHVPYALQAAQERTLARTRRHVEDSGAARINVQNGTFNIFPPAARKSDAEVRMVDVTEAKK